MSKSLKFVLCLLLGGASPAAIAGEKTLGLGRPALPEEINAWNIDVRPDGQGLPPGKGSAAAGETLFLGRCAVCHGEFGEGAGRWPQLAGGTGTLTSDKPEKTVGSFWPYLSTVYDYTRRTMPFGDAQSLTPDETYALVAYLLSMNDLVPKDFELSDKNFTSVRLPNEKAFYADDRPETEKQFWNREPCMKSCKQEVEILGRARVLDLTPDTKPKAGAVD